jgi:hypothetical protein
MTEVLFAFDWGRDALVYANPDESGKPCFIPVSQLVAAGWVVTTAGFREALPRFDQSNIVSGMAPPESVNGVNRHDRRFADARRRGKS